MPDSDISKDDFARLVIDRVRETGVTGEIAYDAAEFQITIVAEHQSILFLGNAYEEYCSLSRADRGKSLRRYVRGWLQAQKPAPDEFDDIRPDILPAVRSRSFFESARLRAILGGDEDTCLPYQTIGEDLGLGLVYDMPDSMKPITTKDLGLWGVTFYEALEAARENIRELRPKIIGPKVGDGVYVFTTNDGYDSSRVILLDLIRQFEVKGDYLAMAPGREMLIVAGTEDRPGLEAMVALAGKALDKPRAVSGAALRLVGDDWEPWLPDEDHPLFHGFRKLWMQSVGEDYAEQKDLLDKLHEKQERDIFVASYSVLQDKESGMAASYCVWTEGIASLLPKADMVALGGPGKRPVIAPWDRLLQFAGDLLEPQGVYPERYRVEQFPTAEQLAVIGGS